MLRRTIMVTAAIAVFSTASFAVFAQTKDSPVKSIEGSGPPQAKSTEPPKSRAEVKSDRDAAGKAGGLKKGEADLDKTPMSAKASKEEKDAARKARKAAAGDITKERMQDPKKQPSASVPTSPSEMPWSSWTPCVRAAPTAALI